MRRTPTRTRRDLRCVVPPSGTDEGLSDAPLSSGQSSGGIETVRLVVPHPPDDPVGQVSFVGPSGLAAGLAAGPLALEVVLGRLVVSLLGDASDVQHAVHAPVAAQVEAVSNGLVVAVAGGDGDCAGAAQRAKRASVANRRGSPTSTSRVAAAMGPMPGSSRRVVPCSTRRVSMRRSRRRISDRSARSAATSGQPGQPVGPGAGRHLGEPVQALQGAQTGR